MFDILAKPSSHGSIWVIAPGLNLLRSLVNVDRSISQLVSQLASKTRRLAYMHRTQLSWMDSQKILHSLSSLPPILMVEEVARVVEEEVAPLLLQMHSRRTKVQSWNSMCSQSWGLAPWGGFNSSWMRSEEALHMDS